MNKISYISRMKRLLIIPLLALCGCEKTWDCHIVTTTGDITVEHDHEFTGSKKEMKEFENSAINNGTTTQIVNCK